MRSKVSFHISNLRYIKFFLYRVSNGVSVGHSDVVSYPGSFRVDDHHYINDHGGGHSVQRSQIPVAATEPS